MYTHRDLQQAYDEGVMAGRETDTQYLGERIHAEREQCARDLAAARAESTAVSSRLATEMAKDINRLRAELAKANAALMAQAPAESGPAEGHQGETGG